MRNKTYVTGAIIIIVFLAIGGVLLAMNNANNDEPAPAPTTSDTATTDSTDNNTTTDTTTPPSNVDTVAIKDFAFTPASITVKVGTKVTWNNEDSVGHTVTADNPSADAPASGNFGKGESYSFTFNKAGTYDYHCQPHPYMKGTVVVTE